MHRTDTHTLNDLIYCLNHRQSLVFTGPPSLGAQKRRAAKFESYLQVAHLTVNNSLTLGYLNINENVRERERVWVFSVLAQRWYWCCLLASDVRLTEWAINIHLQFRIYLYLCSFVCEEEERSRNKLSPTSQLHAVSNARLHVHTVEISKLVWLIIIWSLSIAGWI